MNWLIGGLAIIGGSVAVVGTLAFQAMVLAWLWGRVLYWGRVSTSFVSFVLWRKGKQKLPPDEEVQRLRERVKEYGDLINTLREENYDLRRGAFAAQAGKQESSP